MDSYWLCVPCITSWNAKVAPIVAESDPAKQVQKLGRLMEEALKRRMPFARSAIKSGLPKELEGAVLEEALDYIGAFAVVREAGYKSANLHQDIYLPIPPKAVERSCNGCSKPSRSGIAGGFHPSCYREAVYSGSPADLVKYDCPLCGMAATEEGARCFECAQMKRLPKTGTQP